MKITNLRSPSPGHVGLGLMHTRMPNADRTLIADQTFFSSLVLENTPERHHEFDGAGLTPPDRLKLVAEALEKCLAKFPDAIVEGMPNSHCNLKQFRDANESEMQTWHLDPETEPRHRAKIVKF